MLFRSDADLKLSPFPTLQTHVSNTDAVRQVAELAVDRGKEKDDRGAAGGSRWGTEDRSGVQVGPDLPVGALGLR